MKHYKDTVSSYNIMFNRTEWTWCWDNPDFKTTFLLGITKQNVIIGMINSGDAIDKIIKREYNRNYG